MIMSYKGKWQHFEQNVKGRDFVVGDIHGWFDILEKSLKNIGFNPFEDRLFMLGDLVDRGPYSIDVLKWLAKSYIFCIEGNHERMCKEYHSGKDWKKDYAKHGGQWFIDLPLDEKEEHIRAFNKLMNVFEIDTPNGKVGLVHAEVPVDDWIEFRNNFDKYEEDSLWSFMKFNGAGLNGNHRTIKWIDHVIHGHSNVAAPSKSGNVYYIDTGALTKKLTLLEINHIDGFKAYH
jgi:serine/threonine protein phosphatase 1